MPITSSENKGLFNKLLNKKIAPTKPPIPTMCTLIFQRMVIIREQIMDNIQAIKKIRTMGFIGSAKWLKIK